MAVQGRRDRRVGSREEVAMEERRDDLIRVSADSIKKEGGGGGLLNHINIDSDNSTVVYVLRAGVLRIVK